MGPPPPQIQVPHVFATTRPFTREWWQWDPGSFMLVPMDVRPMKGDKFVFYNHPLLDGLYVAQHVVFLQSGKGGASMYVFLTLLMGTP